MVGPELARAGLDITTLREKLAQNERTFRDEVKHLRIPQAETRAARKVGMVVPPKAVARRPHTGWNYADTVWTTPLFC
jgi:hypothetical protein